MATVSQVWWLGSFILLASVPGALCDSYNIGGLVAAAAASIILLAIIVGMIAIGMTWNSWFPRLQWGKGRVKMPQAYWKKKEEAKLRLLHGSRSGLASLAAPSDAGLPNGNNTTARARDTASWVQGWNNANHLDDAGYEEMALAMELGEEEKEEEVRIETTLVDNETLDLGPFRDTDPPAATSTLPGATATASVSAAAAAAAAAAASSDPAPPAEPGEDYVYSAVNYAAKRSGSSSRGDDVTTTTTTTTGGDGPDATSEKVTSFPKTDPYLVAL